MRRRTCYAEDVEAALIALNQLVADGIIRGYAIGGAVAAAFYIQAAQTEDLDAFVFLPSQPFGIVVLSPIYEALTAAGGTVDREYVRFGSWPVQILTDATPLISEAIDQAIEVHFEGVATRVFRPEHLCALALELGRSKDILRVKMFLEQGAVDLAALNEVLDRYFLQERLRRIDGSR